MAFTIYYDNTTEEINYVLGGPSADNVAPDSGESKLEVADADWKGVPGYWCPSGAYESHDYIGMVTNKSAPSTGPDQVTKAALADEADKHILTIDYRKGADDLVDAGKVNKIYVEIIDGVGCVTSNLVTLVAGTITVDVKSNATGKCRVRAREENGDINPAYIDLQFVP